MHLVVSTVHKKTKTYRYARLVQSYRRLKDGMPAHKIIANLGDLPQIEIDNIRTALKASRNRHHVVVAPKVGSLLETTPILANLRYLPAAVALSLWQQWGLPELIGGVLGGSQAKVPIQDIIAALVFHRCLAPSAKLVAPRWFRTTALPELQGIAPSAFHNTRIHRALEKLEEGEADLQDRLAQRIHGRDGAFMALFMDATDTWFVGHGPPLAQKNRTKEGLYRRRIHILLLCNERGYPLRWKVLPGKTQDAPAMKDLVEELQDCPWVGDAPLVCDRSMGQEGGVNALVASGLRFLTALPRSEFDGYTDQIPHVTFTDLELGGTEQSRKVDLRLAARAAKQAGLREVAENLYVKDLGTLVKGDAHADAVIDRAIDRYLAPEADVDSAQEGLRLAEVIAEERKSGVVTSYRDAALRHGVSTSHAKNLARLLRLTPDIRKTVRDGAAVGVALRRLLELAKLRDHEQQQRFDAMLRERVEHKRSAPPHPTSAVGVTLAEPPSEVRGVLYFNPEMYVDRRCRADQTLAYIHASVRDLNQRLASPRSNRSEASILGEVMQLLRREHLVDVFEVQLHQQAGEHPRYAVELTLRSHEWAKRRRFDGFNVLVCHPQLPHSAEQLVELFRSKDAVEKDFQTIKSVLKLRPVRHRTDPKVRAHVTLCMLALLLERTLEHRLACAGQPATAKATFEELSTCHLNQQAPLDGSMVLYSVTRCTPEQRSILEALDMTAMVDDEEVAETIQPR